MTKEQTEIIASNILEALDEILGAKNHSKRVELLVRVLQDMYNKGANS